MDKQFFDEPVTRLLRVARIIQASRDESEDNDGGEVKDGEKITVESLSKSRAVIVGKSIAGEKTISNQFMAG